MHSPGSRVRDPFHLFPLLALLPVVILLSSCSDDNPNKPEQQDDPDTSPGVIHDNVVAIDDEALDLSEVEGDSYNFTLGGSSPSLGTGDVLVGRPLEGIAPDGYLRKVVEVVQTGGQLVEVVTEPASLLDAIQECDIDQVFTLPIGTGLEKCGGTPTDHGFDYLAPGVTVTGYGFNIQDFVLVNFNYGGIHVFASIPDGRVEVSDPELNMGLIIDNSLTEEFNWSTSCDISLTCDLRLAASIEIHEEGERRLFRKRTVQVYTVAIFFPVVQITTIEGFLGVALDFEAGTDVLMTDLGAVAHIESGASDDGSGWQTTVDVVPDLTPRDTNWDAQARLNVRPYYKHVITVNFYGIGGPRMWAQPYLNLLGEVNLEQWCAYVDVGCDMGVGATLAILDDVDWDSGPLLGIDQRLYEHCEPWVLANGWTADRATQTLILQQ